MKNTVLRHRRPLIVVLHLALTCISYTVAYLLRFDGDIPADHRAVFIQTLPLVILCRGISFWVFRLYEGLWRYASLWDLNNIIFAVSTSSVAFAVLVLSFFLPYPRSVFFIDGIVLVCLLGGVRLARRTYREFNRLENAKRILVYGAGDAGELIVRDILNNRLYNWDVIGFIDDDAAKVGRRIHGVKVLGTGVDLDRIVKAEKPHEIVIAIARADRSDLRRILKSVERLAVPIKTLPNLRSVLESKALAGQVRSLSLEDLMARKPVDLDLEPVRTMINSRCVLVTGAGGSIGSELSRQIASFGPARLLLVERYENSLFELCNQLDRQVSRCPYEAFIADITDARRLERLFSETRPDVVFHAAAHKHVPLMEANPSEAVKNNIRGTRLLAEAAVRHGVRDFVLISSDKAVNPSSVMGATKRVAENIVRTLGQSTQTRMAAVRFGNVLGSNGSVAHIFADQIARGGPVLVTHPDIKRYFMLIPEAVQLVLHAAAMREHHAMYTLDMGEQLRIQDFARNLIRLSGFVPDDDIAIKFIGLRPGEKLYEELAEENEILEPSGVPDVLHVKAPPVDPDALSAQVAALEQAADAERDREVVELLRKAVPTFRNKES
ncbi:MAG TPA: nucleoside-diphosphate sugar epimerase/dehydratase [Vicinamibacterales bacterium]|nr:nucleoside-diphosphate sugar epimerase/dehydratase [Vicinamibacterales bacterium]